MDTLMLLSGGNPVHRKFAETIGAEQYLMQNRTTKFQSMPSKMMNLVKATFEVPNADITICESCYQYPALKKRMMMSRTKIINIAGGPMLYHILSGRLSKPERVMLKHLIGLVDGHLVYGKYGEELLERVGVYGASRVIYPFLSDALMVELNGIKPNLETHNVALIAKMDPHNKGVDLAFKAIRKVAEKYPDVKLQLVANSMTDEEIYAIDGFDERYVKIVRNIPKISDLYSSISLYLQPSRGDMFSVSCIEAMAAGVPCIVSCENGAKEMVESDMVVELDENRLANAILIYFEKSSKQYISDSARKRASFFNERDMCKLFKERYEELYTEIYVH